jgi:acyl carrier protein
MDKTVNDILSEVNGIVRRVLNNDSINLKYETIASEVENWDSLNHIEIIVAVEKHFRIKFNFAELQKFKNVGQMCDNVLAKLNTAKV